MSQSLATSSVRLAGLAPKPKHQRYRGLSIRHSSATACTFSHSWLKVPPRSLHNAVFGLSSAIESRARGQALACNCSSPNDEGHNFSLHHTSFPPVTLRFLRISLSRIKYVTMDDDLPSQVGSNLVMYYVLQRLRWEGTYIGEIVSEWLVRPDVQFRIESMLLIYRIRKADDISSVVIRWLNEKKKLGSGWSRYPPTEAIQTTEIAIARWGQSVYQHCI
ncbi:hypothetical protein GX48_02566 [Paracoccidioides brasiliensis]|nr:hypothetical protein GX48_02566 [Paracoccidioides brasiliensis]